MYCEVLHFEFMKDDHTECQFCNKKLAETKSVQKLYFDLINDTHKVCKNCGTVNG